MQASPAGRAGAMKQYNRSTNPGTIHVLYVDDDDSNQLAMRAILGAEDNITLSEALDDEDAVDFIEAAECLPDVILMDQGLGRITGAEVLQPFKVLVVQQIRRIRRDARSRHSGVVSPRATVHATNPRAAVNRGIHYTELLCYFSLWAVIR